MELFRIYYAGQYMDGPPLSTIREKSRDAAINTYKREQPYPVSQALVALTTEEWELVDASRPAGAIPKPTLEQAIEGLRRAVYERFDNPGSIGDPLEAIQRRATLLNTSLARGSEAGKPIELAEDFVRHWVIADAVAFAQVSADRTDTAIGFIRQSIAGSAAYAGTLRAVDERLADLAGAAVPSQSKPAEEITTETLSARAAPVAPRGKATYQLEFREDRVAGRWKHSRTFDDAREAGAAFFHADAGQSPRMVRTLGEVAGPYAFTTTHGVWSHHKVVPAVPGEEGLAFSAGFYDALESSAKARLQTLGAVPEAPYDASLHEDLESLCGNVFDDALRRRSVLISQWVSLGQLTRLTTEEHTEFIHRWAVADLLAFRKLETDEERMSAAEALRRNCEASSAYAEVLRQDRKSQLILHQLGTNLVAPPAASVPDACSDNGFLGRAPEAPDSVAAPDPFDPQAAARKLLENVTYETQRDGSVRYSVGSTPAFVDHGHQILMVGRAHEDEHSILAGLLLAKEKYGSTFELTGTEEFKRRAIEVMVKYQVDASLKHPAQDALHRELLKQSARTTNAAVPDSPSEPPPSVVRIGKPAAAQSHPDTQRDRDPAEHSKTHAADLVAIRAIDWWETQHDALRAAELKPDELASCLEDLGARPDADQVFWFTKSGRPCDPPRDTRGYATSLPQSLPGFSGPSAKASPLNPSSQDPDVMSSRSPMTQKRRTASFG